MDIVIKGYTGQPETVRRKEKIMRDYVYGKNCSGRPVRLSQKYGFEMLAEADTLYNNGWRSEDEYLLTEEYAMSQEEAETICEIFDWFERLEEV